MTKEDQAYKRIEKELWRIYAPHAWTQIATCAVLAIFAVICFYKAFST